jgi:hypothetical protein
LFTVELKVDTDAIAHMLANRVIKSKHGKATALEGAVVCQLVQEKDDGKTAT